MCIIMRKITGLICACAIYKGCGPSARLQLPPDDFSRNAPGYAVVGGEKADYTFSLHVVSSDLHFHDFMIIVRSVSVE